MVSKVCMVVIEFEARRMAFEKGIPQNLGRDSLVDCKSMYSLNEIAYHLHCPYSKEKKVRI